MFQLYGICPRSRHSCLNLKKNSELRKRIELFIKRTTNPNKRTPFFRYIHEYNFVEIHLDYLNLKTKIPEQVNNFYLILIIESTQRFYDKYFLHRVHEKQIFFL